MACSPPTPKGASVFQITVVASMVSQPNMMGPHGLRLTIHTHLQRCSNERSENRRCGAANSLSTFRVDLSTC